MDNLLESEIQMMKTIGHELYRSFMSKDEIVMCNRLYKLGYILKSADSKGRVYFYVQSVILNKL